MNNNPSSFSNRTILPQDIDLPGPGTNKGPSPGRNGNRSQRWLVRIAWFFLNPAAKLLLLSFIATPFAGLVCWLFYFNYFNGFPSPADLHWEGGSTFGGEAWEAWAKKATSQLSEWAEQMVQQPSVNSEPSEGSGPMLIAPQTPTVLFQTTPE